MLLLILSLHGEIKKEVQQSSNCLITIYEYMYFIN